jgi:hypothetical protein
MIRRIVVFVFPFVFVLAEYALRKIHQAESGSFIGPTLASVGIGQLFPLVVTKNQSSLVPKALQKKYTMVNKADKRLSELAWVFIVAFTLLWVLLLSVSLQKDADDVLFGYSTFYYGLATYFLAVVLAEVKEWV